MSTVSGMNDVDTPNTQEGDGAEPMRVRVRDQVLELLDDAKRPRDDFEARVRWFSNPGGWKKPRLHECPECTKAVAFYQPGAQQPLGPRPQLCKAMNKAYHAAMTGRRQTLWKNYAEYYSLMPVNVGGVLILRGVSGSSSAVEEVQGSALRSAAGASVMEHVNHLLLDYERSHLAGRPIAPYVSPDVDKFMDEVRDLFARINEICTGQDSNSLVIIGLIRRFMERIDNGRVPPVAESNVVQPVPVVESAAEPPAAAEGAVVGSAAEPAPASPVSPASQDDAGGLGDLEGAGDPEHGDVTESPPSAPQNEPDQMSAEERREERVRQKLALDKALVDEIRRLSAEGSSRMEVSQKAANDAEMSLTSRDCVTHVERAKTAAAAVNTALSAAKEAFLKIALSPKRQEVVEVMQSLNGAAQTAEAAVADALAHQRERVHEEEEVAAAAVEAAAKLAEAEKAEAEKRLEAKRQAAETRQAEARKRPVVDDDDDDDDQPELKKLKATDYFTDKRLGKKDAKMNVSDAHQVSSTLERSGRVLLKVPRAAMKSLVDAFCPFAAAETTPWTAVFERDVDMMGDDIPADLLKLWPRRQSVVKERGKAWAGVGKESVQPFLKGLPHVIAKKFGEEPKEASLLRSAPLTRKLLEEVQRWDRYRETKHPFPDPPPGEEGPWPSWQACHMDTNRNGWACIVALDENVWVRLWAKHDVDFGLSNHDDFDAEKYEDVEIPAGHAFFFEAARRHAGFAMRTDSFRVHMQWDDREDLKQKTFKVDVDDVAKHFRWVDKCAGFPPAARGGDA